MCIIILCLLLNRNIKIDRSGFIKTFLIVVATAALLVFIIRKKGGIRGFLGLVIHIILGAVSICIAILFCYLLAYWLFWIQERPDPMVTIQQMCKNSTFLYCMTPFILILAVFAFLGIKIILDIFLPEELHYWLKWKDVELDLISYSEYEAALCEALHCRTTYDYMKLREIENKILDELSEKKGFNIRKYR